MKATLTLTIYNIYIATPLRHLNDHLCNLQLLRTGRDNSQVDPIIKIGGGFKSDHNRATNLIKLWLKVCGCSSIFFHILQVILNRFTQWNLCCTNKSLMKDNNELIWNRTFPNLVLVIASACLRIMCLHTCTLPIVFTFECRIVNKNLKM